MLKFWEAEIELNWDASNIEIFNVKATTETKARKKLADKVNKKYPDIGQRWEILNLRRD